MGLLEREEPLASLAACGDEARLGQGRLVLVAGEAGVGKSALVERFTAGLTGARCYLGACDGLFTPRPLGAFLDIAGEIGGELAELAGRFDASAEREELFSLLLGELAGPGGLRAVVVEDIHWADEATLDLLRFLARRIGSLPVLLVATYRDDELAASYPLRTALGDLAVQRCTRRVDLAPLSAAAVAALSAGSGLDAAELYRVTGGNAFYVTETLRTGLDQVPRSAVDAVLARVAGLGPGARDVLHAAALIGSVVEPWLLERAADCPPSLVDELVDRGLLTADGAVLRFRHEIARRAVAQEIPAHRQPAIHARLLAALLAAGSTDHARLAFHAEAAGDDPATLEHATLAGRHAAELGSHREAAAQFERALRVAARRTARRPGRPVLRPGRRAVGDRQLGRRGGRLRARPVAMARGRRPAARRRRLVQAVRHFVAAVPGQGGGRRLRSGGAGARAARPVGGAGQGLRQRRRRLGWSGAVRRDDGACQAGGNPSRLARSIRRAG